MKKKYQWVDIMKGIGIITVVIAHVYTNDIRRIIYIFHMPLFFFLSGYLFKPKEIKYFLLKKTRHLMLPYISFLIPIYLFFTPLPNNNTELIVYILKPIIGGRALTNSLSVFWFISCLYITQQIANLLISKFNKKINTIIIILFLIISYLNSIYFQEIWLPLNANVIFASLPIFYTGYIFKIKQITINNKLLLLIGITIILTSFIVPSNVYDMKYSDYGIVIITFLSGVILSLNIKYLSEKIAGTKLLKIALIQLGKASMIIMYIHQPIQILVKQHIHENQLIRIFISLLLSYVIYVIISKTSYIKLIFTGSK